MLMRPFTRRRSPLARLDDVALQHSDSVVLAARVLLGAIFIVSGAGKLLALGAFTSSLARAGVPLPSLVAMLGASVEFFGGLAIMLGVATRAAALLMVLFVVLATLTSHRYWEIADAVRHRQQQTQFLKNAAIVGGFLLLFLSGGGRFSVDRWWRGAR